MTPSLTILPGPRSGAAPRARSWPRAERRRAATRTALLALAWVAACGLAATVDAATIEVTTTEDELDLVPNDRCSLREAVVTVNEGRALGVGGCSVSGTLGTDDRIVLPAGTYRLTRQSSLPLFTNDQDADNLDLRADVRIEGAGAGSTVIQSRAFHWVDRFGTRFTVREGGVLRVYEGVTARVEGVTLRGGNAMYGGGVYVGGSLTLVDVAVEGNEAEGPGAGIYNAGALTLRRVTVSGNESDLRRDALPARIGGGVYTTGTLDAQNVTISGNETLASGGLFVAQGAGLTLLDSVTITRNRAIGMDGLAFVATGGVDSMAPAAQVRVLNSIIAGNVGPSPTSADCSGAFDSRGHNLVGDVGDCVGFGSGDQRGSAAAPIDPLLAPLANYGGPTRTHALLPGSPAVDGGPLPITGDCPDTDQRGFARGLDGDGDGFVHCDVGAYEGPAGMSASANLEVSLALTPNPVPAGGSLEHRATVRNNGPGAAEGVALTLHLPAGSGAVTTLPQGCAVSGTVVTCTVGDLGAGGEAERLVRANAPTTQGVVIAEAQVTSASEDPEPGDDAAQATTLVVGANTADLSLAVGGPTGVATGAEVEYVLVARNLGPQTADATARVTGLLPANTVFVSATTGCSRVNDLVTCPVPGLAAGESRELRVVVRAPTNPGHVVFNASVLGEPGSDGNLANNNASLTTRVDPPPPPVADLFVQKLGPAAAQVGAELTYNLVVNNNGPDAAEAVRLTDDLPAGVSVVSVPDGCTVSGGTVTCEIGELEPFLVRQYQVVVRAPDEPGEVVNEARIVDRGDSLDPYPENDASSVTTDVTADPPPPGADLEVVKSAPAAVRPGARFAYTLVVTNHGPDPAAEVALTDELPGGVTLRGASTGCAASGAKVTCAVTSLAAGQAATFTLDVSAPEAEGELVNEASVSAATPDGVPGNDRDAVTTRVAADAPSDPPTLSLTRHPGSPTAGAARVGDEGVTALRFTARAGDGEAVEVLSLSVRAAGAASLSAVRLYEDADEDGTPDGDALAATAFGQGASAAVLTLEPGEAARVAAGGSRGYVLVVDVASSPSGAGLPLLVLAGLAPLGLLGRVRGARAAVVAAVLVLVAVSCSPPPETGATVQVVVEDVVASGADTRLVAEVSGLPLAGAKVTVVR